jgi:hypothetical protein
MPTEAHDNWLSQALSVVIDRKTIDAVASDATSAASAARDFGSGFGEGVVEAVGGVVKGAVAVAKGALDLATDGAARDHAANTIASGAESIAAFAGEAVHDPKKAGRAVEHAGEQAAHATVAAAEHVAAAYRRAKASGHAAKFIGKAVGEGAVLVGAALIPGGAVAEGAADATEGTALISEGGGFAAAAGKEIMESAGSEAAADAVGKTVLQPHEGAIAGLSVEQHAAAAAAAKTVLAKAQMAEPALTRSMQAGAERFGGKLIGLEHRLKTAESMQRKIATDMLQDGVTAEDAAARIGDAVRYTACFPPETLVDGAEAMTSKLVEDGNILVKRKNTWLDERSAYKGVNLQMQNLDGQLFELQFHTPESFRVKDEATHHLYEAMRQPGISPQEYERLYREQMKIAGQLRPPPGIERIQPFKKGS